MIDGLEKKMARFKVFYFSKMLDINLKDVITGCFSYQKS